MGSTYGGISIVPGVSIFRDIGGEQVSKVQESLRSLLVESCGVIISKRRGDHFVEIESMFRPVAGNMYRAYVASEYFAFTQYVGLDQAIQLLEASK
jgi:hypothetical protein